MGKGLKVPITKRALIQRINRKLAHKDERLCVARGADTQELGRYYALNLRRGVVSSGKVDPETWGRELGVLHPWEEVRS